MESSKAFLNKAIIFISHTNAFTERHCHTAQVSVWGKCHHAHRTDFKKKKRLSG